ncbi:MAG: acetyl-CoA carboxylase, carboxyltransferase subunit beta [Candidatus Cellulosilyticum pullistercoris]|uniref:Acetyl-coenzyme A carboxylase carboxyl transferase subunit beta n=1 Tax=Candidatus Cellulosilyticum pullistercoris TaxID=2838521 RepID=A0A9E2NL14_9FIRM|nr:acetyl-CoA carboxylase, carboxyltransferase subunit beta [Candidatus Cellulosilyticum pullistercoris]
MKLKGLLKKKYATTSKENKKTEVPEGIYVQCPKCKKSIYRPELRANYGVCIHCGYHYPLSARARISLVVDKNSFEELDENLESANPLEFDGYEEKLIKYQEKTEQKEAVVTGKAKIEGQEVIIAIMDSSFMMGSMGSVVGEKVTRATELATASKLPLIIFTASGGARMQEGIFSLMQMAKTSAALARHDANGLLYISVLTDPTTGGVTASFATLGDIILAEPGALVGFAGPRVIEQTIREKLPEGFQRAEFLLETGQIDAIVERKELRKTLGQLLMFHQKEAK